MNREEGNLLFNNLLRGLTARTKHEERRQGVNKTDRFESPRNARA